MKKAGKIISEQGKISEDISRVLMSFEKKFIQNYPEENTGFGSHRSPKH